MIEIEIDVTEQYPYYWATLPGKYRSGRLINISPALWRKIERLQKSVDEFQELLEKLYDEAIAEEMKPSPWEPWGEGVGKLQHGEYLPNAVVPQNDPVFRGQPGTGLISG